MTRPHIYGPSHHLGLCCVVFLDDGTKELSLFPLNEVSLIHPLEKPEKPLIGSRMLLGNLFAIDRGLRAANQRSPAPAFGG
jgi:hypothetical protein